jgi:cell division septal protein FtsQ
MAKAGAMAVVARSARALLSALPARGLAPRGWSLSRALPSGAALVVGFGLLAGGALCYVLARETTVFAVRSVVVSGAPPRVAAHVRAALRPLDGRNLLRIDSAAVERRLEPLSDVASVSFDRDFQHTLRLVVTPAHSVAVLRRGPSAWIVSSDGRVIRSASMSAAPRLPRIWVAHATAVDVGTAVGDEDAARAIRAVAVARAQGLGVRIHSVRSSPDELTFVLASGLELRFGEDSALAEKVAVARRILLVAGSTSGYIDIAVPTRPVAGGDPRVSG